MTSSTPDESGPHSEAARFLKYMNDLEEAMEGMRYDLMPELNDIHARMAQFKEKIREFATRLPDLSPEQRKTEMTAIRAETKDLNSEIKKVHALVREKNSAQMDAVRLRIIRLERFNRIITIMLKVLVPLICIVSTWTWGMHIDVIVDKTPFTDGILTITGNKGRITDATWWQYLLASSPNIISTVLVTFMVWQGDIRRWLKRPEPESDVFKVFTSLSWSVLLPIFALLASGYYFNWVVLTEHQRLLPAFPAVLIIYIVASLAKIAAVRSDETISLRAERDKLSAERDRLSTELDTVI